MRKINKTEPPFFTDFNKKNNPNNWADCVEIISDLRNYMLNKEQNGQCAYCESAITSDSSRSHIDHFKRKAGHLFPALEFTYSNLLVSCNSYKSGKDKHCAKSKDSKINNQEDYLNLINPVVDKPSDYLVYSFTGEIIPLNDKGLFTKDTFNLNHKNLVNRRKSIAFAIIEYKNQHFTSEDVINYFGEFETFIKYIWD